MCQTQIPLATFSTQTLQIPRFEPDPWSRFWDVACGRRERPPNYAHIWSALYNSNYKNNKLSAHSRDTYKYRPTHSHFSETEIKHQQCHVLYFFFLNSRTVSPYVNMATTKGWNETAILETTPPSVHIHVTLVLSKAPPHPLPQRHLELSEPLLSVNTPLCTSSTLLQELWRLRPTSLFITVECENIHTCDF
jgi:hypothetical protein